MKKGIQILRKGSFGGEKVSHRGEFYRSRVRSTPAGSITLP